MAFFQDGDMASESLVKNHDYGLAVVDIMLPGKDGFALLPELKSYGVPVIFLTARGELSDKVKGLTGGAEDYMVKPFEMLELLVRIDKILKRFQQVNRRSTLRISSLTRKKEL